MAVYTLKISDTTQFKDLAVFTYDNKIKEGDEIVLEINVSYNFDFIFRRVLFLIVREGISNNRKYEGLKGLPESKNVEEYFFDDESLSKAMLEETGVQVSFK